MEAVSLSIDPGIGNRRLGNVDANQRAYNALLEARQTNRSSATANIEEESPLRIRRYFSYPLDYDAVKNFGTASIRLKECTRRDLECAFSKFLFDIFLPVDMLWIWTVMRDGEMGLCECSMHAQTIKY